MLTKGTVQDWLGRRSKDNPTGLNPEDNGEKDADKRNPIYIQQIEEQDYMKETDGKLELAGITIGIGMNRKDYYQKNSMVRCTPLISPRKKWKKREKRRQLKF